MNSSVRENLYIIWDYMHMHMEPEKADCIVGFGNRNLAVPHRAAQLYHQGYSDKILFSGGLGRNTGNCWQGTEAEIFAEIAIADGVPEKDIILETKSSNTAENILFVRDKFLELGMNVHKILAVHQQFMERRIYAALKMHWPELNAIITSPDTTPEEYLQDVAAEGMDEKTAIEVIVGDFQRMDVYAKRGWQIPQAIPPEAERAFSNLVSMGYTGQLI